MLTSFNVEKLKKLYHKTENVETKELIKEIIDSTHRISPLDQQISLLIERLAKVELEFEKLKSSTDELDSKTDDLQDEIDELKK